VKPRRKDRIEAANVHGAFDPLTYIRRKGQWVALAEHLVEVQQRK
jgi:hypothetical protein